MTRGLDGDAAPAGPARAGRIALRVLLAFWLVLYNWGYACLRGATWFLLRPLYGVRTIGRTPRFPRGGFLVCANHASWLDPAFVQIAVPRRIAFLMTSTWYRKPVGAWFFRLVAAIPVDTGQRAHQALRDGIERLRRGRVVGIFPEGRLSRDGAVGPAQRGVAILARMAGVPVLPIGIAGNFEAWPHGGRPRLGDVRLAFGPWMRWSQEGVDHDREDEQAFADRLMEEIRAARARAAGAPPFRRR